MSIYGRGAIYISGILKLHRDLGELENLPEAKILLAEAALPVPSSTSTLLYIVPFANPKAFPSTKPISQFPGLATFHHVFNLVVSHLKTLGHNMEHWALF